MTPVADPAAMAAGRPLGEVAGGAEWMVDARGCAPERLDDVATLAALFARVIEELALCPVAPALWHAFPAPAGAATAGGVTGVCLLAESHLTVHTFPEHGSLCLNLFCCRPRPEWDFAGALESAVGARDVTVRRVERRYGPR